MVKSTNTKFKKPTTDKERDAYARMYTPLVYKIANQNKDKLPLSYSDILGFGFEGLTDAMNTYNEGMGQTFLQYAAYRIFYFIMNNANKVGHIVSFSSYYQKKAKEKGDSTHIFQRLDAMEGNDDASDIFIHKESPNITKILDDLRVFVSSRFSKRDTDIFFKTFGLGESDDMYRTQIAKQYGVTNPVITYANQRIIKAIKADDVMREELEDLL
jgi:DNA-directed RNA polymerase specialized sigma subunit